MSKLCWAISFYNKGYKTGACYDIVGGHDTGSGNIRLLIRDHDDGAYYLSMGQSVMPVPLRNKQINHPRTQRWIKNVPYISFDQMQERLINA